MERPVHTGAHFNRRHLRSRRLLTQKYRNLLDSLAAGRVAALACSLVAGLTGLAFYLTTLAPGLSWANAGADGGELAAAAYTLGVPHPPGFPTYILLAHPFTLLPFGQVAARTNLFSALCAAAAAALVAWSLARASHRWPAALCAGLALALSPLLWSQAVITEVYALNALFVATLLSLSTYSQKTSSKKATSLALTVGAVWGFSLGNHPTAIFAAPLVLLAIIKHPGKIGFGLAGFAAGLSVYTALPILAANNPPINWGNPQTIPRLLWLISAEPYRQNIFSIPLSSLPQRILSFSGLITTQFSWPGLIVIVLGTLSIRSKRLHVAGAILLTIALYSAFAIGYNTADSYLYLLPVVVCLSWLLGVGVDWLLSTLSGRSQKASWLATIILLAAPLLGGFLRHSSMDLSNDRSTKMLEQNVLEPAPSDAIIISHTDAHTFTLWYWLYAERKRPDITVVDIDLLSFDWYRQQVNALLPVQALAFDQPDDLKKAAGILHRPLCHIEGQIPALNCVH